MTFTSKKEADAYDKMLDIADNLIPFLTDAALELPEPELEKLAFYLAEHKDDLGLLLKGAPLKKPVKTKKSAKVTAAE